MTTEQWTQVVRQRLGLGRLLPLGGPRDGVWIAERAAQSALRQAAKNVPGTRLDTLRIALADPQDTHDPAVPAPPSALPSGPLRVTADFAATPREPLPTTAALLRSTLAATATERLGLTVTEVDLRVTSLLGEETEPPLVRESEPAPAAEPSDPDENRAAAAALTIPGVTHLTAALGRPVHIEERQTEPTALPHRHVRLELAAAADHRTLDVARQVRTAVSESLPDHPTVAVLVTAVT